MNCYNDAVLIISVDRNLCPPGLAPRDDEAESGKACVWYPTT